MRIDDVNLGVDTDGKTGKVRAAVISFENRNQETGERVGGQFAITLDEYAQIQAGDLTPQAIAERKLIDLLAIKPEDDVTAAFVQLSEQLAQKDLEISALQQMIVELTLMLSMIGQPELPTDPDPETPVDPEPPVDPDPEPPVDPDPEPPEEDPEPEPEPPVEDPEPPVEEPPTETPEEPPVEDPPQEDPDIPPEEGAPDDPEPETPADPVADDPDTTPIDEGGEGGE